MSDLDEISISDAQIEEAIGPPPQDDTVLRVGQYWMSNGISTLGGTQPPDGTKGVIFEIVGFQELLNAPMLIATRQWEPAAPAHPGNWAHLGTHVYSHRRKENMFSSSALSLQGISQLINYVKSHKSHYVLKNIKNHKEIE